MQFSGALIWYKIIGDNTCSSVREGEGVMIFLYPVFNIFYNPSDHRYLCVYRIITSNETL